MLLLVDHLALRARNYEYLIQLFQEWEVGAPCRPGASVGGSGVLRRAWGAPGAPGCLPLSLLARTHKPACTRRRGAGVGREDAPTRGRAGRGAGAWLRPSETVVGLTRCSAVSGVLGYV